MRRYAFYNPDFLEAADDFSFK
ncbi:protein of unknown function (plasmid) [Cupriavidus taiwanensis]|uniref:Uncharacterized protein n=1 Tax=Cupriavidus taiwanensis TaxID=164546 RepID=A0A375IU90_9BURK|nr:protein of unknown function [Cupriavidus taiwanensis]